MLGGLEWCDGLPLVPVVGLAGGGSSRLSPASGLVPHLLLADLSVLLSLGELSSGFVLGIGSTGQAPLVPLALVALDGLLRLIFGVLPFAVLLGELLLSSKSASLVAGQAA